MYAVGHTSHTLISLSNEAEAKVRERKKTCGRKFKGCFYRSVIKNEVWSFVETYEEAKATQALLFLDGAAC